MKCDGLKLIIISVISLTLPNVISIGNIFLLVFTKKWMIDFYEAHLSPPCTSPSLSHPIITVVMTYLFVFQGMTFFIPLFLSLSSALEERGARHSLKAAGSQ